MGAAGLVNVADYLRTTYRPDCDFVDGALVERNVGLKDHSKLVGAVLMWFWQRRVELQVSVFPSLRIRISASRIRVADICVVRLAEPDEQVLTSPPCICMEVLSPEDTFVQMQARFDDYLAMGVENVWALDPETRRGWRVAREGHLETLDGILRSVDGRVVLPIAELFTD